MSKTISRTRRIGLMRILISALVALCALALLDNLGGLDLSKFGAISPGYALLAVLFSSISLFFRAVQFRGSVATEQPARISQWLNVSFRHEALSGLLPFMSGDMGFPYLANRYLGIDYWQSAYAVLCVRLRDVLTLLILMCVGMFEAGIGVAGLAVAILLIASIGIERILALLHDVGARFSGRLHGILTEKLPSIREFPGLKATALRALLPFPLWLCASAAIYCAYNSMGVALQPADALVLLGLLILSSLVAVTIAGLGTAEAGSTAALMWIGMNAKDAIVASLAGRPVSLITRLLACLLWWLAFRLGKWLQVWRGLARDREPCDLQEQPPARP